MKNCMYFLVIWLTALGAMTQQATQSELTQIVAKTADEIFALQKMSKLALHLGRKSLLQEMVRFPDQLEQDIVRIPITIGSGFFGSTKISSKDETPLQLYEIVSKKLTDYVNKNGKHTKNKNQSLRIGAFHVAEVIYALVQNFSAPSVKMFLEDPLMQSGEWGPKKENVVLLGTFLFDATGKVLVVSLKTEKTLVSLPTQSKKKALMFEHKAKFDLDNGEVTFEFGYAIDGKGKSAERQSFVKP